jgi:ribosome-binding factor A
MQGKRLDRVNQLIKEEISTLLQRELKDPRLGFVTVTEVAVSKDLRTGKVFVSVLGDDTQWASSLAALESARGFMRNWLRNHLDLRVTPHLEFRADRSLEHGARIQALLRDLRPGDSDENVARSSARQHEPEPGAAVPPVDRDEPERGAPPPAFGQERADGRAVPRSAGHGDERRAGPPSTHREGP